MADASPQPDPARRFGEMRRLPALSVVVTACGSVDMLRRCLTRLLAQDYDHAAYEIVVVDPESREEVRAAVGDIALIAAGSPPVQYVVMDGREGLAAARNRGWMFARGAVLAFIDADAVPTRHWLDRGMAALTPGVAAVQGRVRMALSAQPSHHEREIAALAQRGWIGSNCFVSRVAMVAVGGFDERFSSAWRSDADLQFSLIEHFHGRQRVRREPLAEIVLGPRPVDWRVGLKRQYWTQFDELLRHKHPALYRERIIGGAVDIHTAMQFGAVLMLAVAIGTAAMADLHVAAWALLIWSLLTLGLCLHRFRDGLEPGQRSLRELAGITLTLVLTSPVAVFWRLVGVLRFRALASGRRR